MPKLTILVGPPGSGKSTLAKDGKTCPDNLYINQDSQGKQEHLNRFMKGLESNHDIVVDRMNFNKEQRFRYLAPAKVRGYTTEVIVLHESYDTCLTRCLYRKEHETIKTVEDATKALNFFFKTYERVEDGEADIVTRIWPEGEKPSAIICDLDGTLCNIGHRIHWVRGEGKKNWPMFFAGIKDDIRNRWCAEILEKMRKWNNIVLCSGRGKEYENSTKKWLSKHAIYYHVLFMRPEGDYRRDDIVKEIILDFEILTRYTPYFAIDDRQQVVDMWRKHGIVCLQCAKGDF